MTQLIYKTDVTPMLNLNKKTREHSKNQARRFIILAGNIFKQRLRANCPKGDSNRLANSMGNPTSEGVYELSNSGLRLEVGTRVPYAAPIEIGVSHSWIIYPTRAKWLRWEDEGGGVHFAKKVVHPPMKAKYFMLQSLIETANALIGELSSIKE